MGIWFLLFLFLLFWIVLLWTLLDMSAGLSLMMVHTSEWSCLVQGVYNTIIFQSSCASWHVCSSSDSMRVWAIQHPLHIWYEQNFCLHFFKLGGDKILFYGGFNLLFPDYNNIDHLFTCLLTVGIFFSVKCLLLILFACFLIMLFVFILIFRIFLHVFWVVLVLWSFSLFPPFALVNHFLKILIIRNS